MLKVLFLATLYLPLLEFIRVVFKRQKHSALSLIQEIPDDFTFLVSEIALHLKVAYETLQQHESHQRKSKRDESSLETLYSLAEAKSIVELTVGVIKSIVHTGGQELIAFLTIQIPEIMVSNFLKGQPFKVPINPRLYFRSSYQNARHF